MCLKTRCDLGPPQLVFFGQELVEHVDCVVMRPIAFDN